MATVAYTGNQAAIIFTLTDIDNRFAGETDSIIRTFAENGVPLDVAIRADADTNYPGLAESLREYADAGIIDVSLDGRDVNWLDIDMLNPQGSVAGLSAHLATARRHLAGYFGFNLAACVFPYEWLNEYNYGALEGAGFRIISTRGVPGFAFSRQPVDWSGGIDASALYRLPIVGNVNYQVSAASNDFAGIQTKLLAAADESILARGVAVIELQPYVFSGDNNKTDAIKIRQLGELVKSVKSLGEVVTFDGWSRYVSRYAITQPVKRNLPPFAGGTAVIFRLDDVAKDWYEDVDMAIIKIFQDNGVPLDCGVISNAGGTDSFDIPWLKQYVNDGVVGISVHGYDWTYYQLDTTKSGLAFEMIKYKLVKARDQYLQYYGVLPVAVTVPTDFYDESGYRAVQEAGFKIFATQSVIEPHPSNQPVDYSGHRFPGGMYRIPTASDISDWDPVSQQFGNVIDVSDLVASKDTCQYYMTASAKTASADFAYGLCKIIGNIGVAAISIHPTGMADKDGKPDRAKLKQLDTIVKWVKSFATITTFEQWYNYASAR
jgi:hypothetical protein